MADRVLTEQQQAEALQILGDVNEINADTISMLFAYSMKVKGVRFSPNDVITIGPNESPFVKPGTKTTLGIYIQNKYLYEDLGIFGYVNKTITGKINGSVDEAMANALTAGDITRDQYGQYIDRAQWLFGGPLAHIINISLSETVMSLPPAAKATRKKLLEENKKGLEANDPQVSSHVEKEVVTTAINEMKKTGDPSIALFDSGCGIDPYNQYRTIFVMKGAIQDNTGESPTGYKVVTSNYDTGISKDDMAKIADAVVTTAYSSGVSTQDSGTNGKKYNALFQRVRLQSRDSDCKTDGYLTVTITQDNYEDYIYRNVIEGSKLVMLVPDNIKSYIGKTVKMRSGIYCKAHDPEYCAACVGDRPYRIGVRNIGFTYLTISGSTLNGSLKKKHDVSIKLYTVTLDDILKYVQ